MNYRGDIKSPAFQSAVIGLVIITFILAEIGTFLIAGQTEVIISQVFYLPIILITFMYPRKAVPLGLGVGIIYLVFSLLIPATRAGDLLTPFMQFYVYVSLAVLLASFFTSFKLNEKKYESLFRHTHSAICIVDTATRIIVEMNPRFQEVTGTKNRKTGTLRLDDLFPDVFPLSLTDPERNALETGSQKIFLKKADGTDQTLLASITPIEEAGFIALFLVDITPMVLAEQEIMAQAALLESENMFRSLSRVAPVGIFLIDSRGNYFFVNDQWCRIMDLSIDDAAGQGWLNAIHPEDRMAADVQWQSFIGKGNEITIEHRLLHKDGSIAWVYFRALARRTAEGIITGYVGTIVDITDRKKYEETLKASLDEKSVLIMEIHHRVKNNLQIISGLIRLQSRQITNEQALAALHECETRVITMALVHESLYQSGNLANINAQRHITNLANTLLMSDDHEGHIKMDIDVEDMPLDMNTAVPASLIINELVTNSLKHAFSGRDHGTIRISLHQEPDNMLVLTVGDDGVGIPPGMNIMETGSLGMKLVMRLVRDQLKGTLTILSDKGMSFAMRFPAAIPATGTEKGGSNAG